jgi:CheY-like chemotaxis protein
VLTAADCSEALAAVGEQAPDLIIVDLNFPPDVAHGGLLCWDGFQLMLWLRGLKNAERAKYIVITASDTAEVRKRARTLGALTVFGKPVNAVELLKLVEAEGALPCEGTPLEAGSHLCSRKGST